MVYAALEMEVRAINKALRGLGEPPAVHLIGIMAVRLKAQFAADCRCIIMAGLGGALERELKIGDVVVDDRAGLISAAGEQRLSAAISWRRGGIYTADRVIATPAEKAELHLATGAAAVDMEGAVVRALAKKKGIGFISIRAISDTADQTVIPQVMGMIDDVGRPRPLEMTKRLAQKPGLLPELFRLADQSKRAGAELGKAVKIVMQELHRPG